MSNGGSRLSQEERLNRLKKNRRNILLCELAALLHDMGKGTDEFLFCKKARSDGGLEPYKAVFPEVDIVSLFSFGSPFRAQEARHKFALHKPSLLDKACENARSVFFDFLDPKCQVSHKLCVAELILIGRPFYSARKAQDLNKALRGRPYDLHIVLGRCHAAAHVEKEETQEIDGKGANNAFGCCLAEYRPVESDWTFPNPPDVNDFSRLGVWFRGLEDWLKESWRKCPGDTRWSVCEVDLWSWSKTVAALTKSIAAVLYIEPTWLRDRVDSQGYIDWEKVKWRLLAVRVAGLDYLADAVRPADLIARRKALEEALNRVRDLLEVEYPVGTEVYRDENGSVFVISAAKEITELFEPGKGELWKKVIEKFCEKTDDEIAIEGEIIPEPQLIRGKLWFGQAQGNIPFEKGKQGGQQGIKLNPDYNPRADQPPPIGAVVAESPGRFMDVGKLKGQKWVHEEENGDGKGRKVYVQVCPLCGVRPRKVEEKEDEQGKRLVEESMCEICEERLRKTIAKRAKSVGSTIWIDEVADKNGRVALIACKFDLSGWLRTDSYIRSLAGRRPEWIRKLFEEQRQKQGEKVEWEWWEAVPKVPSFARMYRVWRTCSEFWGEVVSTLKKCPGADCGGIEGLKKLKRRKRVLKVELETLYKRDGLEYEAYDLIVDKSVRLEVRLRKRSGEDEGELELIVNPELAAQLLGCKEGELEQRLKDQKAELWTASHYGGRPEKVADVTIKDVDDDSEYIGLVDFEEGVEQRSPRLLLLLVPADAALDVVRFIRAKYEREMGKVRNRLPLHIRLVFAHRYTPMRALMDAAFRLLDYPAPGGDASFWRKQTWEVLSAEPDPQGGTRNLEDLKEWVNKGLAGSNLEVPAFTRCFWDGEDNPERRDLILNHFRRTRVVRLKHELFGEITWRVPLLMGDGTTEDVWYPYVYLADDKELQDREKWYRVDLPGEKERVVVHVSELRKGDRVVFEPATFDWVWLDSAGRRYGLAYQDGRRLDVSWRPYLLDEIDDIDRIWRALCATSEAQMLQLREALQEMPQRLSIQMPPRNDAEKSVWEHFCKALVRRIKWTDKPPENAEELLINYAVNGRLLDVIELFHSVLKMKMKMKQVKQGEKVAVGDKE